MAGESDLCVEIQLGEGKEPLKFSTPMDVFARFWPLLLWAAASSNEVHGIPFLARVCSSSPLPPEVNRRVGVLKNVDLPPSRIDAGSPTLW